MTTQHLGQDLGQDLGHGRDHEGDVSSESGPGALSALLESSPAVPARTSAAAEIAFLAGLVAVLTAPFSLTVAASAAMGAAGLVTSVVGLARASRPAVAGGLLASVGLVLALTGLAVVGLRYAGIDTAVGDPLLPTLADWLRSVNGLLPPP